MRVIKYFVMFVATAGLSFMLVMSAFMLALRFTIAYPDTIKAWLKDSGVYTAVVDEVTKLAAIEQSDTNSAIEITSEDVKQLAGKSFTAEKLEQYAGSVIDGFYGWFRGDTVGPEFKVDLSAEKEQFATLASQALAAQIQELPACASSGRFSAQAFQPFEADCVPPGLDIEKVTASLQEDLSQTDDFLPDTVFTGSDLKINNSQGQPAGIGSALSWVPQAYTALLWVPIGVAVITALMVLVIIFLSTSRRKGFRRVAGALTAVGLVLLISGFLLRPIVNQANRFLTRSANTELSINENIINPLFDQVIKTYSPWNIYFGAGYLVTAMFIYGGLLITKPRKVHEEADAGAPAYNEQYMQGNQAPESLPAYQANSSQAVSEPVGDGYPDQVSPQGDSHATQAQAPQFTSSLQQPVYAPSAAQQQPYAEPPGAPEVPGPVSMAVPPTQQVAAELSQQQQVQPPPQQRSTAASYTSRPQSDRRPRMVQG